MEFGIRQEQRGEMPLLRVQGELDIYTAPRLKEAVLTALGDGAGFDWEPVEETSADGQPTITSSAGVVDASLLNDGDLTKSVKVPISSGAEGGWLRLVAAPGAGVSLGGRLRVRVDDA